MCWIEAVASMLFDSSSLSDLMTGVKNGFCESFRSNRFHLFTRFGMSEFREAFRTSFNSGKKSFIVTLLTFRAAGSFIDTFLEPYFSRASLYSGQMSFLAG